jgi:hypothetical protein
MIELIADIAMSKARRGRLTEPRHTALMRLAAVSRVRDAATRRNTAASRHPPQRVLGN